MKLAIIFLNKTEHLEELLSLFLEIGVTGATVMDSIGMGHIISENIPIFAGLREAFAGSSPNNKIIMTVTDEETVQDMVSVLEDLENDDEKVGFLISLPIDHVYGLDF